MIISDEELIEVIAPLRWKNGGLELLDQRLLPSRQEWVRYTGHVAAAKAIVDMVVRGAPAIGCAAAYAVVLGAFEKAPLSSVIATLRATRPTAVNLFWALDRMARRAEIDASPEALLDEALRIHREDIDSCRAIGVNGAALLPDEGTILTHCNAGALATGGYGTALGVIRAAVAAGKRLRVLADETRPFLQGSRLTAWELQQSGIDVRVITDNMAAWLMQKGEIQAVVVGADRIARNGDTANKIGTYSVALAAREHQIPFYVAAPKSTIDVSLSDGSGIPIEERPAREVTHVGDHALVPAGVGVRNPAFDVTPSKLVAAVITEAGIAKAPYLISIPALFT